eukprot:1360640-Amphidinium_carterae.1
MASGHEGASPGDDHRSVTAAATAASVDSAGAGHKSDTAAGTASAGASSERAMLRAKTFFGRYCQKKSDNAVCAAPQ